MHCGCAKLASVGLQQTGKDTGTDTRQHAGTKLHAHTNGADLLISRLHRCSGDLAGDI